MQPSRDLRDFGGRIHPKMDLQEAIWIGTLLFDWGKQANRLIAQIKDIIRERLGKTPGQHLLAGQDGTQCLLTVPSPSFVLAPDINAQNLRQILGPAGFDRLFKVQETLTLRDDFGAELRNLDPAIRLQVMSHLEMSPGKPRVSFQQKHPP